MRKGIALCVALALLLALTGCTGKQESTGDNASIVVGFSQLGAESSWRIANTVSMEQAAKEYGFSLMMENANQKQEKQIDAIRSFIAYRVDVIVFSPIVETGWDNVLTEAKQAGIPVILMDAIGAEHLRIAEICGTTDSTPMRDRQRGFMDVIGKDQRFEIVDSVDGDFLRSKGEECMRELLQKYGTDGIDVIYSHNDSMTLGALDVLESLDNPAAKDIILITVDGEKEAVEALKAGRLNCVVQCTPHLGPAVMKMVGDLKAGRELAKVNHPEEGYFSDFDDLTDPRVEGF